MTHNPATIMDKIRAVLAFPFLLLSRICLYLGCLIGGYPFEGFYWED